MYYEEETKRKEKKYLFDNIIASFRCQFVIFHRQIHIFRIDSYHISLFLSNFFDTFVSIAARNTGNWNSFDSGIFYHVIALLRVYFRDAYRNYDNKTKYIEFNKEVWLEKDFRKESLKKIISRFVIYVFLLTDSSRGILCGSDKEDRVDEKHDDPEGPNIASKHHLRSVNQQSSPSTKIKR